MSRKSKPIEQRFWKRVNKAGPIMPHMTTPCWVWTGSTNGKGYGHIGVGKNKLTLVHRLSYTLHLGAIPEGMFVCHKCDNPQCVRPDHLFIGTVKDNVADMISKGRQVLTKGPGWKKGNKNYLLVDHKKGESHPSSKLTESDVVEVRSRWSNRHVTKVTQQQLANEKGVSRSAISEILRGRNWKHISQ